MTDLDKLLAENEVPTPRSNLADKILAAAETATPANDELSRRPWWAMGGIAAMALMAAMFVMQPTQISETETDWVQIADASGFTELYQWVEGDES